MNKINFGKSKNNEDVFLYSFENEKGWKMIVSNLGAVLTNLWITDKSGKLVDVVLGFDTLAEYETNDDSYLGATVGRSANRLAEAKFELNGVSYQLSKNDNENNLHSGPNGYQIRMWEVKALEEDSITFFLHSPDGDQGYPGALDLEVSYQLTEEGIKITYLGQSDKDTIFNPTNHSYFNLNGHQSGTILNHRLQLNASGFTPMKNSDSIPTGEIISVEGTPMDFRISKVIGQDIDSDFEQLVYAKGYDHNFVLDKELDTFAELIGDQSGIRMKAATDLPGVQFYSGNFFTGLEGKEGAVYKKREGMCLETQYFPNAVNEPNFDTPLLEKNKPANYWTTYTFDIEAEGIV